MKKVWNFLKAIYSTITEAKELRAKEAMKKNNYYHM